MSKVSLYWLLATSLLVPFIIGAQAPTLDGMTEATDDNDYTLEKPSVTQRRTTYPEGAVKEITTIVDRPGEPSFTHGETTLFYPSGSVEAHGNMVMGKRHGNWTLLSPEGLESSGPYENGQKSGKWQQTRADGTIESIEHYAKDQLHGSVVRYHPNGQQQLEEFYVTGELHGDQSTWYPTGMIASKCSWIRGERHGEASRWTESGTLWEHGFYRMGLPHSTWTWLTPEGELLQESELCNGCGLFLRFEEGTGQPRMTQARLTAPDGLVRIQDHSAEGALVGIRYEYQGRPHGLAITYSADGHLSSRTQYTAGVQHGMFEEWHLISDGNKQQLKQRGEYHSGARTGLWTTFRVNGTLETQCAFENDRESGEWVAFWSDTLEGQKTPRIKASGNYVHGRKNGPWTSFYGPGLPATQETWVHGERQGPFAQWYATQSNAKPQIRVRGGFDRGKPAGIWESFFADGKPDSVQSYRNGVLDGDEIRYFETGRVKSKSTYIGGKQWGPWQQYFPDGKIAGSGSYSRGLKDGVFTYYNPISGLPSTIGSYENGMPVGTWIWYAADGKTILDQQLFVEGTGEMMQYSPEGLKEMQTTFVSGSREGPNRTWYPNGVLKSEGTYRGGVLHGTLHEYHTTGVLGTRSEWLWGRKEGRLENWYTNEKPRIVATYRNDLLDGEAREWNEEGNLRSSGTWRQGVRDGVWRWYDDSGQATFTLTYDAGILITSQTATRESDPPISIQ